MKLQRFRSPVLLTLAACVVAIALAGCADPGTSQTQQTGEGAAVTYATLTAPTGDLNSCAGCHSHGAGPGFDSLSLDPADYAGLLTGTTTICGGGIKFVNPGNKATSALYLTILPTGGCTNTGFMVGAQSSSLAAELGAWIDAGAPQ